MRFEYLFWLFFDGGRIARNAKSIKLASVVSAFDALYLPSIKITHIPTFREWQDIMRMARVLMMVIEIVGPISVNSWIRPTEVRGLENTQYDGFDYNGFKGGSKRSKHIRGLAVDFDCISISNSRAKELLIPHLSRLGIRIELGVSHNHIDIWFPGENRTFRPRR